MSRPTVKQRVTSQVSGDGNVEIIFKSSGAISRGRLQNLSSHGVRVKLEKPCTNNEINSTCELRITSHIDDTLTEINANARIVQSSHEDVGLYIYDLDSPTRAALVNMMLYPGHGCDSKI